MRQTARAGLAPEEVESTVLAYRSRFDTRGEDSIADQYATITAEYYNLVTDFYEWGWGKSFHFAVRHRGEHFEDSLINHEMFLADALALRPEMRVADLGCGVGGPMRNIAKRTGARITGVNINSYQVEKIRTYNEQTGLSHLCDVLLADFLNVPLPDASFDAIYAIEATCHAPTRESIYREAARLLKPGGLFAMYEWCMTPDYDPTNDEHQRIKHFIERGNGIAELSTFDQVHDAMAAVDFEVLEARDRSFECDNDLPWYSTLDERSLKNLPRTAVGRKLTNALTGAFERIGVLPKGTQQVSSILNEGADRLVAGGKLGIFTPMYYVLSRKKA